MNGFSAFKARHGYLPTGTGESPESVLTAELDLLLLSGRGSSLTLSMIPEIKAKVIVDLTGAVSSDVEDAFIRCGVCSLGHDHSWSNDLWCA